MRKIKHILHYYFGKIQTCEQRPPPVMTCSGTDVDSGDVDVPPGREFTFWLRGSSFSDDRG